MINGWNSRFNLHGDIVSGAGQIYLRDDFVIPGGKPEWMNIDFFAFIGEGDKVYKYNVRTKKVNVVHDAPTAVFSAGDSVVYIAQRNLGEIAVSVDRWNGQTAILIEHNGNNNDHSLSLGAVPVISHQSVHYPRSNDGLLAWIKYPEIQAYGLVDGQVRNISVVNGELLAVPFMTPEGPWVTVLTQKDLRLHPWGSSTGYIIPTGEDNNFHPDTICINGIIHCVYNTHQGVQHVSLIPLTAPRTDVGQKIIDSPTDPKEPEMTELTESEIQILEEMGQKFPNSWHGEEENARQFSIKCAQQLDYSFPDRNFGVKKADNNRPISKDSVARQDDALIESWDIITGTGTGLGTFNPRNAGHHDISDQIFVEVEAKNWLGLPDEIPDNGKTHKYIGGGNDSGTCDDCNQPRFSDIHKLLYTIPHIVDLGEDGKGPLCDICHLMVEDRRVHGGIIDPPPSSNIADRLELIAQDIQKIVQELRNGRTN